MNNSIHLIILSIAVIAGGYYVYKELNKIKMHINTLESKDKKSITKNNEQNNSNATLVSENIGGNNPNYEYTDAELVEDSILKRDFANFKYESDTGESENLDDSSIHHNSYNLDVNVNNSSDIQNNVQKNDIFEHYEDLSLLIL